jgi:hypothetical protein
MPLLPLGDKARVVCMYVCIYYSLFSQSERGAILLFSPGHHTRLPNTTQDYNISVYNIFILNFCFSIYTKLYKRRYEALAIIAVL